MFLDYLRVVKIEKFIKKQPSLVLIKMVTKLEIQRKRFIDGLVEDLIKGPSDKSQRRQLKFLDTDWRDERFIRRFQDSYGNLKDEQQKFFDGLREMYRQNRFFSTVPDIMPPTSVFLLILLIM